MPALGLVTMFAGYSVLYYGITQVRGENFGFLDLVLPSRWVKARADSPPNDGGASMWGPGATAKAPATPATGPVPPFLAPQQPSILAKPPTQGGP